jgi:hypothetical protein
MAKSEGRKVVHSKLPPLRTQAEKDAFHAANEAAHRKAHWRIYGKTPAK